MRVLFLGGVFDDCHYNEIISKTRTYVESAANNFQKKIIYGFQSNGIPIDVISVPFLGAYPTAYSDIFFDGFKNMIEDKSGYQYCSFNNLYGFRNVSRYRAAKKSLKSFVSIDDSEKLIIVYAPHTPFLKAANWAKRKDPRIKICMIVPDLPQYMDLSKNVSFIYKFLKRIDIRYFYKENDSIDSYVLLTEQMAEVIRVGRRPYMIVEGIYEPTNYDVLKDHSIKTIVYTGKLNEAFGALNLVKAFVTIDNPNIRLDICGSGESKEEIIKIALTDSRISFKGQVSSDEARRCIAYGDILVNPRPNDSIYTKYSFPSKIIDYLSTGNAVIAFKLDGMPSIYNDFVYFIPQNTIESIAETIVKVINADKNEIIKRANNAIVYLKENLSREAIAKKIIALNYE